MLCCLFANTGNYKTGEPLTRLGEVLTEVSVTSLLSHIQILSILGCMEVTRFYLVSASVYITFIAVCREHELHFVVINMRCKPLKIPLITLMDTHKNSKNET